MAMIKKMIDWVKGEDMEDEEYQDYPQQPRRQYSEPQKMQYNTQPRASYAEQPQQSEPEKKETPANNVVSMNSRTPSKLSVVLVKPDRFENAAEIADHLKEKHTVVLNLEQTHKEIARRLVDFLSGVAYANEGKIKRVANSTYIITPYNVDILGDLLDELEATNLYM